MSEREAFTFKEEDADVILTVLTGSITVTEDITGAV